MAPLMDSWRSKWNKSRDFVVDTRVNGLLSIVGCIILGRMRIYLTERVGKNFFSCS